MFINFVFPFLVCIIQEPLIYETNNTTLSISTDY